MTKQEIIRGSGELMPPYRLKLVEMIILGKYPEAEDITFFLFGGTWVVSFQWEWLPVVKWQGVKIFSSPLHFNLYVSDVEGYDLSGDIVPQYNTKRFKQK